MQTFQQYYPTNQSFNQQINPYMQRMEYLQQFQQNINPTINQFATLGKIVESVDIVKSTDIPMDGNVYYFPKADGTEIYTKQWQPNGQTRILAFKPILEEETIKSSTNDLETFLGAKLDVLGGITDSLNTLHDKIDKISKQNTTSRAKKGEVADE